MSSSAESARQILGRFAAGQQLVRIVDGLGADVASSVLCTAAQLVHEAGSSGAGPVKAITQEAAKCTIPDLTFTTPWGKFSIQLLDQALLLKNTKSEVRVPTSAIKQIAVLDRFPKDGKERVLVFVVLHKPSGVMHGKQPLESLVLQMLADTPMRVEVTGEEEALEGPAPVVVCSVFGRASGDQAVFVNPEDDVYQSTAGAPCITASYKAHTGVLYPLQSALYFVERPPLYLAHDQILSYELQRAGGTSQSFDLVFRMRDGKVAGSRVEFNIAKSELGRLQTYIERSRLPVHGSVQATTKEARSKGDAGAPSNKDGAGSSGALDGVDEEEEDEGEEEDEDFDPEASDDSCGGRPARRTRGRAAGGAGPSDDAAAGDVDGVASQGASEGASGSEEGSDEGSSGSDSEDDGSVDYTDEEDIPVSKLKSTIAKEQEEVRAQKRSRVA